LVPGLALPEERPATSADFTALLPGSLAALMLLQDRAPPAPGPGVILLIAQHSALGEEGEETLWSSDVDSVQEDAMPWSTVQHRQLARDLLERLCPDMEDGLTTLLVGQERRLFNQAVDLLQVVWP
jgi:hypothetical protein